MYFGATTSYRAGGFNLGNTDGRLAFDTDGDGANDTYALGTYNHEQLIAYEIGYEGTHFDGTLQLNIAVYYYDYEGCQSNLEFWESEAGDLSLPNITRPDGSVVAPAARGAELWRPPRISLRRIIEASRSMGLPADRQLYCWR